MSNKNDNNSENNQKLSSFLDTVAKMSGIAASMSLLLSIIYDYAYFNAINITFSDVPTSISDHLRTGLIWFPALFFGILMTTILELITLRFEKGMSEDEIISTSPDAQKTQKLRKAPSKLYTGLAGLMILTYILMGENFTHGLPIAFCIIWFRIAIWINNHPRIIQRRSKVVWHIIYWLPALIILIYGMGYSSGKKLINNDKSNCSIILKNPTNKEESIILIRLLEKGILFKKPGQNKIIYETWDNIKNINKIVNNSRYQGIIFKHLSSKDSSHERK